MLSCHLELCHPDPEYSGEGSSLDSFAHATSDVAHAMSDVADALNDRYLDACVGVSKVNVPLYLH